MHLKTPLSKAISTTKHHLSKLENLGIENLGDFLRYFPRTYNDQSNLRKIIEIRTDDINVIKGTLSQIIEIKTKYGKKLIKAKLTDETGSVDIVWFNQQYLKRVLYNGQKIILSGRAKFELGKITLISPEFEASQKKQLHTARIVPVYHETDGLNSKWIREKINPLLKYSKTLFTEYLPAEILKKENLMSYHEALIEVHFPNSLEKLEKAKNRLAFDELFLLQLKAIQKKWLWQQVEPQNQKIIANHEITTNFINNELPFELTNAQKSALNEIIGDLEKKHPMSRLLQGDVGSGKTIVAGLAIMNTILNGYQSALMAPTEILAEQHYKTIFKLFKNKNFNIKFLSGSTKQSEKKELYSQIENGTVDLIIGTHALIQQGVKFNNLGLAVIDEQHRFGVEQRSKLKEQQNPNLLSMTATPIPRTLAMTVYGDQDLSIIDEMPKGRIPIITRIIPEKKRKDAYNWIKDRIKKGRQAFVICPLVDESDTLELKSVVSEYEYLQNEIFPELKLTFIHGKLKAQEKEKIMTDFKDHKYDLLVSTSVIEVGIDIPNASIILIEGAERFGLSQLHQFRGRVGRGEHQSYCFLFMQNYSQTAIQRLKAMVDHTSGFKLSEIDLELRGSGHIYGIRQSGIPDLKMASLSDSKTITTARKHAENLIENDPYLKNYPKLAEKISELEKMYIKD
ncbi:ATP-dependent DNA helicase RecG [Candidatus Peregrinibacteria bacterium]|nr:ATP-dependent DNA helicase RecG [Candidatus Peregrinibacteria bacterium]